MINKRNIGSVMTRYWRRDRGKPPIYRRPRHVRSTSSGGDSNNEVVFFRSYRAGSENNPVIVDLRTEALMRGMG